MNNIVDMVGAVVIGGMYYLFGLTADDPRLAIVVLFILLFILILIMGLLIAAIINHLQKE